MVYGRARSPRQIWIPGMGVGIWDGNYGAMIKLQYLREIKRGLTVTDRTPPNIDTDPQVSYLSGTYGSHGNHQNDEQPQNSK